MAADPGISCCGGAGAAEKIEETEGSLVGAAEARLGKNLPRMEKRRDRKR
jgi:hypothetical protein